jgi:NitT/TauT family transport system ATP-binding protein
MRWTANVDNHTELAQMLARPAYLDTDYHVILNGLNNAPRLEPEGKRHPIASYLSLGGAGNVYPHADSALWLYAQMRRWGQAEQGLEDTVASLIDQSILKTIQKDVEKDEWVEQRSKTTPPPFDGVTFNPKNIEAYWQSFPIGKLIKT